MIIEGEMALQHEGHHSTVLKPYEQDSFSGGWTTKSKGRAKDFNLMLSEGCIGELEVVLVANDMNIKANPYLSDTGSMKSVDALYCAGGAIDITLNINEVYNLRQGDLMLVYGLKSRKCTEIGLKCTSQLDAAVIRAGISYI